MVNFGDVDTLVARYHQRGGQPGLAYGIVIGGQLVHSGGLGERWLGGPPPDAGTVFRIASMTKSFTASAILALRDDGLLKLDDLAQEYVSELRGWPPASPDAARISIRHLLTMTAGFPTDDPWGDRQQGLPLEDFARFLAGGVRVNWAPGTRFEYSNLGYAILGRVITAVTGEAYPDYIRHRLLGPLGLKRTGYHVAEFEVPGQLESGPGGLARGYRRSAGGWLELGYDPAGAFAPMGGVFSCVGDLSRWVAGFAAAFPPGDPAPPEIHPLRPASRREMQMPQVLTGWDADLSFPGDGGGYTPPATYGFGLFVDEHPALGRVVSHSGGYPGFGSNMCWHPGTGIGAIALGNSTYAGMAPLAARMLEAVVTAHQAQPGRPAAGAVALAPGGSRPWPETLAARTAVSRLLQSWDEGEASRLFASNVVLDAPFAERQRRIALVRERIGDFREDPARAPEFDTPAHCRWWLAGERGVVQVQIQLTPERAPRVQSLALAVPPAAGSALRVMLDAVVAWLNGTGRDWPQDIGVADGVDTVLLARRLGMAAAWAGPVRLGACKAGDGTAAVMAELVGRHATITLSLAIDPETRVLRLADVIP
jgi:CubicO group peptidase (beta-lactamase class C family)